MARQDERWTATIGVQVACAVLADNANRNSVISHKGIGDQISGRREEMTVGGGRRAAFSRKLL